MKVIVFAATKGGTGKTTLAWNTALHAAQREKVLIGDLDPQKSLTELWGKRGEPSNPRLVSNIETVGGSVRLLKEAGYERDYLIVDLPGSIIPIIRDALSTADLVVLPVQPSPMDLLSQEAMFDLVDDMGLGDRTMFVLNRVQGRSDLYKKAMEFLKVRTGLDVPVVKNRADYARAAWSGKGGCDLNKQCRAEIATLWAAIEKALEKTKPKKVKCADD